MNATASTSRCGQSLLVPHAVTVTLITRLDADGCSAVCLHRHWASHSLRTGSTSSSASSRTPRTRVCSSGSCSWSSERVSPSVAPVGATRARYAKLCTPNRKFVLLTRRPNHGADPPPPDQAVRIPRLSRLLFHHAMLRLPERPLARFRPPQLAPQARRRIHRRAKGRRDPDRLPDRVRFGRDGDARVPPGRADFGRRAEIGSAAGRARRRGHYPCGQGGRGAAPGKVGCDPEWRREHQAVPRVLVPQQQVGPPDPEKHSRKALPLHTAGLLESHGRDLTPPFPRCRTLWNPATRSTTRPSRS